MPPIDYTLPTIKTDDLPTVETMGEVKEFLINTTDGKSKAIAKGNVQFPASQITEVAEIIESVTEAAGTATDKAAEAEQSATDAQTAQVLTEGYKEEAEAYRDAAAAIVSGGPRGVYATEAALIAANPDHAYTYVVTADGHWYYWNGSTFADGGVYQTVQDYATKEDISIIEQKSQKYDIEKDVLSTLINKAIASIGNVYDQPGYSVKVYSVTPFETLKIKGALVGSGICSFAFYSDSACTSLVSIGSTITGGIDIFTQIPFGANYIGVTNSTINLLNAYTVSQTSIEISDELGHDLIIVDGNTKTFNKTVTHDTIITDKFITNSGSLSAGTGNTAYSVLVYQVTVGEAIKIKGQTIGSLCAYAFYSDSLCTNVVSIGELITGLTRISNLVVVPDGAYYIGICKEYEYEIGMFRSTKLVKTTGDSLTMFNKYQEALISKLGAEYTSYNGGCGGEDAREIMARQGGSFGYFTNHVVIPATITPVIVGAYPFTNINSSWDDQLMYGLIRQANNGVNPITIDGIECAFEWDGDNYTLTRLAAGAERQVYIGTPIVTKMQSIRDADVEIYWIGTNGGFTNAADLVNMYKAMIEFSGNPNYLIIGLHYKSGYTTADFETLELAMVKAFSTKYINLRKYTIQNAIPDLGLVYTPQDLIDISNGVCPASLMTDGVHFTDNMFSLIGNKLLYERGLVLGYWS